MQYALLTLLLLAIAFTHCLVGGTRLLYSMPGYGILALAGVLTLFSIRRNRVAPDLRCLSATLLLAGYVLVRSSAGSWIAPNLGWSDFYMVTGCALVYLLVAFFVTNPNQRALAIAALLVLAIADLIIGLIQFTQGTGYMPFGFRQPLVLSRANGFLVSPDHLAGFLEVVGVMGLSLVVWGRSRFALRILLGYVVLCCYAALVITGSRGGYLSAMTSLAAFAGLSLFTSHRANQGRSIVASVLSIGVIFGLAFVAVKLMAASFFLSWRMANLTYDDIRFPLWQAALDHFRVSPWLGTGGGTYLFYGRFFRRTAVQADPVHVHNDYLELLAEYGIIGGLLMAALLVAHLFTGGKSLSRLSQHRLRASPDGRSTAVALQIGALSAVAAYLAHSMVDFNLHIPGNALLLAFVFGILASSGVEQKSEVPKASLAPWFRFALPLAGVLFLGSGLWHSVQYLRAGLSLKARRAWTAAMILPKLPGEFWLDQARMNLRDHAFTKCADSANTGLRFEKQNPDLYLYLGEAYRMQALQMQQMHRRTLERAQLMAAEDAYRHGLLIFPTDETLLVRLAQTLDGQRRFDEAEAVFIEAMKADPNQALIRAYFGAHLKKMGRFDEAAEQYRRAEAITNTNLSKVGLRELGIP